MNKTPAVRFKEFSDEWEQRKLGNLGTLKNGMNFSKDAMGIGFPFVNLQDIFGKSIIDADNLGKAMATPEQLRDYNLIAGDVLFVRSSVKLEGVGETALVAVSLKNTTYSGFIIRFRDETGLDSNFKRFVFATKNVRKQILSQATDSANKNISQTVLSNLELYYPAINEQKAIGVCFSYIDNLSTRYQCKYEKLKNIKKSMLYKMFPQNGSKVPEIRFAGFTGDWEQRKLASLCNKFTDGDWIESKDQSDSGVRLVQTGNVGLAEYLDKPNNKKWISAGTFDRLHCEEVLPGDILISRLPEPAGRACIMPFLGTKMITAVDCTIARTASDVSNKFLVQYLSSQAYFDEVNTCLAGGTRQRISRSNLADFDVLIPAEKLEQDAIGTFFGHLDNFITLHQRKLEKLEQLKQAMLHKMFV